jgi:hypothetical protein
LLREADILCDRLAKSVRGMAVGRPLGSASAPDRREPPRVVLRAVDGGTVE